MSKDAFDEEGLDQRDSLRAKDDQGDNDRHSNSVGPKGLDVNQQNSASGRNDYDRASGNQDDGETGAPANDDGTKN